MDTASNPQTTNTYTSSNQSLQQSPNNLQNTANQTVPDFSSLDQGTSSIPLAPAQAGSVAKATMVAPVQPYHVAGNTILYGSLGLVIIIFFV